MRDHKGPCFQGQVRLKTPILVASRTDILDSDMPLIVSLELHTSQQQQHMMVDIMKETWGPHLVVSGVDINNETPLPTLGSLLNRILIKVKYTAPGAAAKKSGPASSGAKVDPDSSSGEEEDQFQAEQKGHIIPELGSMGIFTRSCHFESFDQPEASMPTHVFSLSENKLIAMHKHNPSALFRHNKVCVTRLVIIMAVTQTCAEIPHASIPQRAQNHLEQSRPGSILASRRTNGGTKLAIS